MSRAITVTVLAGVMLTGCCLFSPGCGRPAPDHAWYDANGNVVEEKWKTDANGNKLLDAEGRPIPDPHVPYDRHQRPWVFTNGVWAPLTPPSWSSSSRSSSSSSWWRGSSYRSSSSSPSYRPALGSPSSSSSSSISRGGFGTTGLGSSSS
jgi:hypothetical protein